MSPNQSCRLKVSSTTGCTFVISKTGGCLVITPSGQTITLHRRQRTYWLQGRISTSGELGSVDNGRSGNESRSARTPSHQKQPVRPIDHCYQYRNHDQSCKKTVATVNCYERPMETHLRCRQKQRQPRLEAPQSCRPLAERQRHRLVHLPFRWWCTFCVIGRRREESHKKREKR